MSMNVAKPEKLVWGRSPHMILISNGRCYTNPYLGQALAQFALLPGSFCTLKP